MERSTKPEWLKAKRLGAEKSASLQRLLISRGLHSVCQDARCPNRGECYEAGTATFLILGGICTRGCRFCAVEKGTPPPPDLQEPYNLAITAREMGLKHVVVTCVTRDDLPDQGAGQFVAVINNIRAICPPSTTVEVLVSDLGGRTELVEQIVAAGPEVFNHNVETISRLYSQYRPQAVYARSLNVLQTAAQLKAPLVKSGFMVGLGETPDEVEVLLHHLFDAGVNMVTIGQYLAPGKNHPQPAEYVTPQQFAQYARMAQAIGFAGVQSGPLVRSSYHAGQARDILAARPADSNI